MSDGQPEYDRGNRRCPRCGGSKITLLKVPQEVIVPHRPRVCDGCGYSWTPQPTKGLALLYFLFGLTLIASGPVGLGLVFVWVREWLADDLPFGLLRAGLLFVMLGGSALTFAFGLGCLRLAKHILSIGPGGADR